jgi:hypothetical protein
MILARLNLRIGPDGRPILAGATSSAWNLPVGTPVVLVKRGHETYELREAGPTQSSLMDQSTFTKGKRDERRNQNPLSGRPVPGDERKVV